MSALDKLTARHTSAPVRHELTRTRSIVTTGGRRDRYLQTVLHGEADKVSKAPEGTRNATLNTAAFCCAQFADLDDATIEKELASAGVACGLGACEISLTIASGIRSGRAEPREIPTVYIVPPVEERGDAPANDAPKSEARELSGIKDEVAKKPRVHVLGPSEIFATLPPIRWIVQGLDLCPGAPSLFAGYGYSGKSMALQSMALQLAAGSPVWGAFAAARGACVHLDYEQGEHLSRLRYQRLAHALDLAPQDLGDRLQLVCHPRFYLDEPEAESILLELCAGKTMAVIDSFRAACRSTDENSSEARVPLDMLGRISEQTGCAFAVIHHARKPNVNAVGGARDSIRGSGALYDACGSVFVLEGQPDDPARTIHHVKARVSGKTQDPMTLRIEDEGEQGSDGAAPGIRVTVGKAPSTEELEKRSTVARFEKLKREVLGQFSGADVRLGGIDSLAKSIGRKAPDVRSVVNVLLEEGVLESTGTSNNTKGYRRVGT